MEMPIVKAYFSFLCTEKEPIITTAWMLEETGGVVKGYGCVHGKVKDLADIWRQIGIQRCSLHTTLNRTNLKGRKSENMESARVFCVDIDRQMPMAELGEIKDALKPGMIVESSPGKYHFYWRCPHTISWDIWSKIQTGLAQHLGGDYSLAHKTHLIRVPGFQRVTKTGKIFTPRIVHQDIRPQLADVKSWHWLDDAIEKGEEERNYQIGEMVKLARQCVKAKGILQRIPDTVTAGQRNITLYAAVRGYTLTECEQVSDWDSDDEGDAIAWGLELNSRFNPPLPEREAITAIRSGIQHGLKAVEKRGKREAELRSYLASTSESISENTSESIGAQEVVTQSDVTWHIAEKESPVEEQTLARQESPAERESPVSAEEDNELRLATEDTKVGGPSVATVVMLDPAIGAKNGNGNGHREQGCDVLIPTSPDGAATRLVELLCGTDLLGAVTKLAAAVEFKTYNEYVKYLLDKFNLVGAYRKDGPCLFLREKTRWGSEVKYPVPLSSDQADWFISKVVSELGLRGLNVAETADKLRKPIHTSVALNIAKLWYKAAISQPCRERQRGNVIVFQNGVLELGGQGKHTGQDKHTAEKRLIGGRNESECDGDNFIADSLAPLKYSHPIWCYFHRGVAIGFRECIEKGWPIAELVRSVCPKFYQFCQDWFPHDRGVMEVLLNWFGYSFTTDASRQKFMFFYGPTRSGKGSLCRTLCAMAGLHNYSSSDYSSLDEGFKAANMFNKLIISMEESEATAAQHNTRMGRLKKLIGGEKVTFEQKYKQPFEDDVIGKFVLQANEIPEYQDKGHAIRARMIAIGFEHSFEESERVLDPAQVILESEADKLATIAALCWSKNCRNKDAFKNSESRAMQLGLSTVIADLDIVGNAIQRYLKKDASNRVSTQAIGELVLFIAKEKERSLNVKLTHVINTEIKARFPEAVTSKINRKRRAFLGIKLDKDLLLNDYPELESPEAQSNSEILVLLEELGLLNYKTEIVV